LLWIKIIVVKSEEVKTTYKLAEPSKEGYGSKRAVFFLLLLLLLFHHVYSRFSNKLRI
jgi:hypothetical protein